MDLGGVTPPIIRERLNSRK